MGILDGKKAIIIGASGGIGLTCAELFLEEGAAVSGSYRKMNDKLQNFSDNHSVYLFSLDLSCKEKISAQMRMAVKRLGGIDILVNAAGITEPDLLFSANPQKWENVIQCNLLGIFYTMQSVIIPMLSNKGGSIINISSVFGIKGGVGQSSYCVSKAGIIGLTKSTALELAEKNIRINAVAPGYIETAMTAEFTEEFSRKCMDEIPMKRFGTAKEVAHLCAFLASERSAYITGQTFVIDGGLSV